MNKEIVIAQDIDECLFNSVKKHHQELTIIGRKLGWTNLPTYEELCLLGGTHGAYGEQPGYWEINKEMRNSPDFNRGLESIEGSVEALNLLQAMLGIYLTTRPESLTLVSEEQIDEAGLPKREVVCRPKAIPLAQTTEWKLDVLGDLAKERGQTSMMIDDSVSLHKAILNANDPNIETILFNGPMTPKGNGEMNWGQIRQELLGENN